MIKLYNFDELKPEEILNRDIRAEKNVEDVVDGIIADVRARGDEALKEYALRFDGAKLESLQVTQEEIEEAFAGMDGYFLETLREAAANIEAFHRQQVHKLCDERQARHRAGPEIHPHREGGRLRPRRPSGLSFHRPDGRHPGQGGGRFGDRHDDSRR